LPFLQAHDGLLATSSCVSPAKSLLWFVPEPAMTALFGAVHPVGGVVMEMHFLLSVSFGAVPSESSAMAVLVGAVSPC
jgi:hypothetical protein